MFSKPCYFGMLTVLLLVTQIFPLTAIRTRVMVQVNDTAVFAPLFSKTDTTISQIVPAFSQPAHGTITLLPAYKYAYTRHPGGQGWKQAPVTWFRYVPSASFTGLDSFTFTINTGSAVTNSATCMIRVHPKEPGGMTVLIVANQNLNTALGTEINRLKQDLDNEGYTGKIIWFTHPIGTPTTAANAKIVWDLLISQYDSQAVAGALLIGRIPYYNYSSTNGGDDAAMWNMSVWMPDFSADSINLQYGDAMISQEDTTWRRGWEGNSMRHIWVGRFWGLNTSGSGPASYGPETLLLKRMLDANHNYRTGASRFPHKAYCYEMYNYTYFKAKAETLQTVWPEAFKDPIFGKTIISPDTFWRAFTAYQSSHAGELWDVCSHMNADYISPNNNGQQWVRHVPDTVMNRPVQQRTGLLSGCHVGGIGTFTNAHLWTRGGGMGLATGSTAYIQKWGYYSLADTPRVKFVMRRQLIAGERWGRAWIKSGMALITQVFHGDPSLKPRMFPANNPPIIDSLRCVTAGGRTILTLSAGDMDGSIQSYEWWFSKRYNYGRNEPDTVTSVPILAVDAARCTAVVRVEVIDNYLCRSWIDLPKDSTFRVEADKAQQHNGESLLVCPNPFNPATTVNYMLAHATKVRAVIMDPLGRTVCVLTDGVEPAGERSLSWKGENQKGLPVASGLYYLLLERDGRTLIRSMLLMK